MSRTYTVLGLAGRRRVIVTLEADSLSDARTRASLYEPRFRLVGIIAGAVEPCASCLFTLGRSDIWESAAYAALYLRCIPCERRLLIYNERALRRARKTRAK